MFGPLRSSKYFRYLFFILVSGGIIFLLCTVSGVRWSKRDFYFRVINEFNGELSSSNHVLNENHPNDLASECSERATINGGMNQKVLSYSLYQSKGAKKEYVLGIVENYKRMEILYPGWVMRVYTDIPLDSEYFQGLENLTNLYLCDVSNLPNLGDIQGIHKMVWRFMPISDPMVAIFLSRDLDSVLLDRERWAVAEWEESNKIFHAMRDHPQHSHLLQGGLWGVKTYLLNTTTRNNLRDEFLNKGKTSKKIAYGSDQTLIGRVLYKQFQSVFMIHDSYHCMSHNSSFPFPEKRTDPKFFVGGYAFGGDTYKKKAEVCPVECRPSYGKDWTYC